MLVPQDAACLECNHARRDHELTTVFGETCTVCGCTANWIDNAITWNPSGPRRPFNWTFALVTFCMWIEDENLYTDAINQWRPGYSLQPGEREELQLVETLIRDLWARYRPSKPRSVSLTAHTVVEENADVDRYEEEKDRFWGAILRLLVTDEWRSYFPAQEHSSIENIRQIIIRRGGTPPDNEIEEWTRNRQDQ